MRENLSFTNIFKREMKLASYIIICVTTVVISLSYAMFFQVDNNSKNQEVIAGDLTFTYTNGGEINSTSNSVCFVPMTKEEAELYTSECSYKFSVRNTGTLKANYTIKLKAKEENTIELEKIKVILKKQNGETMESVYEIPKKLSEIENGILATEEMESHQNIVYSVQLYIEEESFLDGDEKKKVSFEIEGSGVVHEENGVSSETLATIYIERNALKSELVDDETVDHNLRYIGANPNNYVLFNDELWRVIGVMNNIEDEAGNKTSRVKIIRNESIGSYSWDTSDSTINAGYGINEWSQADAMKLLNPGYEDELVGGSLYWNRGSGNCYNGQSNVTTSCDFCTSGLMANARNMVASSVWNLGSNGSEVNYNNIITSKFYELEGSSNNGKFCTSGDWCNDDIIRQIKWLGYVSIMYPSDYGYATSGGATTNRATCLNTALFNWNDTSLDECKNNNWLFNQNTTKYFLTSSAGIDRARDIFILATGGDVTSDTASHSNAIYPTLYLKPNVKITTGDGSMKNPYQLKL